MVKIDAWQLRDDDSYEDQRSRGLTGHPELSVFITDLRSSVYSYDRRFRLSNSYASCFFLVEQSYSIGMGFF